MKVSLRRLVRHRRRLLVVLLLVGALVAGPAAAAAQRDRLPGGGQPSETGDQGTPPTRDATRPRATATPRGDGIPDSPAVTTAEPSPPGSPRERRARWSNNTTDETGAGRAGTGPTPGGRSSGWWATSPKEVAGWAVDKVVDSLQEFLNGLLGSLWKPIVGTPTPEGADGWLVFGTPTNSPWTALYDEVYLPFVLPLAAGLLFIAQGYVGIRAGGLNAGRRRRLMRRICIAWLTVLLWFPLASVALHLFDAIGFVIATGGHGPTGEIVQTLGDSLKVSGGGAILALLLYAVESVLILLAAVAFAVRWLGLIVLTLTMPLLAVFWAVEIWPLAQFAEIARRAAAVYPGLLVAGLPAAILLRIAVVAEFDFGFGGLFAVLLSAMLIPAAGAASVATVLWSNRAVGRAASQSAYLGDTAARQTPAAVQGFRRTSDAVNGARNVHRGLTQQSAVRADGQAVLGGGDSRAHRFGQRGRRMAGLSRKGVSRGRQRVGDYRTAYRNPDSGVGGLVKDDLGAAGQRARRAARATKEKVSRW